MTSRRTAILTLGAGTVLLGGMAAAFAFGGYRVNFTPSYAYGLWRIEPLDREVRVGDRLFVCPPPGEAAEIALARGYLPRGLCPSGTGPLIKTVAALPGQSVEIAGQVIIDGEPLSNSSVLEADAEGRAMHIFGGGIVMDGTLYLHSDFVGSYDSRYFGPLPAEGTLGLAREVLTFAP
ncbi:conjugative transfer signal peptidase TraF [Brucella intermedia]|uniref:Conjugal transfer pilin processing protease TraF n=1 Tax=Brucella intermedia M86 TaxID=1234597 RepID=M5K5N1_9HYPH|nr:conjugal transfer pilin processing protease TraF [Brucella intermedia M86]